MATLWRKRDWVHRAVHLSYMENKNSIKYFLYARKSSESDEKQVQSIDDQISTMEEIGRRLGIKIIDTITESKSAKEPHGREKFENMIERIKRGEANGILCWKIDRLSRNPIDSATIQWLLQKETLASIQTPDREYCPEDNALLLSVESSMANQYIRDLSKNVKRGLQSKLDKGWRPGSAPLGYLNTKTEIRGENYIVEDPVRFPLIRKMWDMMLTGNYTAPHILDIANKKWGFTTRIMKKRGNKQMGESTIYRTFSNPFYAGIIEYSGKTYEGKHTKMVTLEEFDKVQILLGRKGKPRPKTHEFAFTGGCIKCGECDCFCTAIEKWKIIKKTGELKKFTYYFCTKGKKDFKCTQNKFIPLDKLEEQIEKEIEKYTIPPQFRDWALEILRESNDKEIHDRSKIYEMQHHSLTQAQTQLDNLTKMRYRDLIGDEEFIREKATLQSQITRVKEALRDTETRAEKWLELTEKTFTFAAYARTAFLKGDLQSKKEILTSLGLNCVLKDKKLFIEAYEWFVALQKGVFPLQTAFTALELDKPLNHNIKPSLDNIRLRLRG